MERIIEVGQLVRLRSHAGEIERVLVGVIADILLVCRKDDYERARSEQREPVSVGFKRRYLVH